MKLVVKRFDCDLCRSDKTEKQTKSYFVCGEQSVFFIKQSF